jgi:DNA-binding NarL/FixJ family response regulator
MSTVLIVDDHPVFRRGLTALLRSAGFDVVAEAASSAEAIAAARSDPPDIVLMDLGLPDQHGLVTTGQLLAEHPGMAVVVITMFDDPETVAAALRAGAIGYVVKDTAPEQVVVAVRAAEMGASMLSSGLSRPLPAPVTPTAFPGLTPREQSILDLIGKGLPNPVIAQRLALSQKTVANYVSTVLLKIGAVDRLDAARMVRDREP